jgi:hypothetical protein
MSVETVKTKITQKVEDSKTNKSLTTKKQKSAKTQIILVSIIVTLIAAYIMSDILFFKSPAENKMIIVNKELDSLQMFLNKEIPKIDNANTVQQKQLEELQNLKK